MADRTASQQLPANPPAAEPGSSPSTSHPPTPSAAAADPSLPGGGGPRDSWVEDASRGWQADELDAGDEEEPQRRTFQIEFASTIPARVIALANESGAIYLQHVYALGSDVLSFLPHQHVSELYDQARASFEAQDKEAAAVAEGRHVGRL